MDFAHISEDTKQYFKAILECIDDGVWITDGEGNVIEANDEAIGVQNRDEIIGKNMQELVDQGIYKDSATLRVLESKEKVTMIQNDEEEVLVTGIPYVENGKIEMIVCCERELNGLQSMKEQLRIKDEQLTSYKSELAYLRSALVKDVDLVYESKKMSEVTEMAVTAARYGSRVLIQGETGVGKEVIAKIIYKKGSRRDKPFIAVNCCAIPENLLESELFGYEKGAFTGASDKGKKGYFELANKGILFLDEIGDISLNFQAKLLRAIQENEIMRVGGTETIPIDAQIIVATNQDLAEKVKKGEFRADLYYRLNIFPIKIPSLRERKSDIVPLTYHFLKNFNREYGTEKKMSLGSLNALLRHDWPGNIRELESVIERLVLTSGEDMTITERMVEDILFEKHENAI